MKPQIVFYSLIVLAFLVSCTGQIDSVPVYVAQEINETNLTQNTTLLNTTLNASVNTTNQSNITLNNCENIKCGENQACANGTCNCIVNTKKCGTNCIAQNACCTDNECPADKICFENTCAVNNCDYNEQLDKITKTCQCVAETTWCDTQKKCIPKNSCCVHTQCGRSEACVKYRVQANVCVDKPSLTCKRVVEGESTLLNNQTVLFSDARQNATLLLKTGEGFIKTQPNKYEPFGAGLLYVKEILPIGGVCVDDED